MTEAEQYLLPLETRPAKLSQAEFPWRLPIRANRRYRQRWRSPNVWTRPAVDSPQLTFTTKHGRPLE